MTHTRRVALVAVVLLAALGACDSDGPADDASSTSTTTNGSTPPAISVVGGAPDDFSREVARACVDIAEQLRTSGVDLTAQSLAYNAARARMRAVTDRTTADDEVVQYIEAQLRWLQTATEQGMGKAGPPPAPPPAAARCRQAGSDGAHR